MVVESRLVASWVDARRPFSIARIFRSFLLEVVEEEYIPESRDCRLDSLALSSCSNAISSWLLAETETSNWSFDNLRLVLVLDLFVEEDTTETRDCCELLEREVNSPPLLRLPIDLFWLRFFGFLTFLGLCKERRKRMRVGDFECWLLQTSSLDHIPTSPQLQQWFHD